MGALFEMSWKVSIVMIRLLFRHLGEAVSNITRNIARSFLAMMTVGLTLFLVGIFSSLLLNVSNMAQDVTSNLELKVFIDKAATQEDEATLKTEIEQINNVSQVTYSSKDEQLTQISEKVPSFKVYENDANPLYNVYIVTVSETDTIKTVAENIRQLKFVYKVNDGGTVTDSLVNFAKTTQFWGMIFIALLLLVAIVLIMNTIRATIISRQTEIEIMRLVGATKWFIRWPFLLEGALIGFLGSVVPMIITYILYSSVYHILSKELALSQYSLLPINPFAFYIVGGLGLAGILLGSLGSIISIRRFLKK